MAKFNDYWVRAENDTGNTIVETTVTALGLEQAWHKAVAKAFEARDPSVLGDYPETITVARKPAASESQG